MNLIYLLVKRRKKLGKMLLKKRSKILKEFESFKEIVSD